MEDKTLVQFVYEKRPECTILSHRGDEVESEVPFQDMQSSQLILSQRTFEKIWRACDQAALENLKYLWIDICCINKDSSAELSKAINPMYG